MGLLWFIHMGNFFQHHLSLVFQPPQTNPPVLQAALMRMQRDS